MQRTIFHTFIAALGSIFFPVACAGCGARGVALCKACIETLPHAISPESLDTFAVYDYGNRVVELAIRNLKYYRKGETLSLLAEKGTPFIAEWIGEKLQTERDEKILLVPIPQHQSKTLARGFNQSELLATILSQHLDGARVTFLLKKIRRTRPQAHMKNKTARLENLKYSMKARGFINKKALHVLVDDVTTTGATFAEATRALRAAGAKKILAVALAHGYAKRKQLN